MLTLLLLIALQDDIVKQSDHELAPDATVTIKTVVGRVTVRGTDEKSAHVKTVKRGRDRDLVEIKVEADKDRLSIEAIFPKGRERTEIELELDVQVPRTAKRLAVDTVSGSVEVKEAKGHAELTTVSGPIRVEGLTGNLSVVTISGKVAISKVVSDRATFTLTSGNVEGSAEVRDLEVTTVSGRATLEVTPKGTPWSVKSSTISGALLLRLPAGAGAGIDLSSLSGRLECDFELKDARRNGKGEVDKSLRGTFGDGAGSIRASSISGDVKLTRGK